MRHDRELRDALLAHACKARLDNQPENAYLAGFLEAYAEVEALAERAKPEDPDGLSAVILQRFAACRADLRNRTDPIAAGRAGAWEDAAHALSLWDLAALNAPAL